VKDEEVFINTGDVNHPEEDVDDPEEVYFLQPEIPPESPPLVSMLRKCILDITRGDSFDII